VPGFSQVLIRIGLRNIQLRAIDDSIIRDYSDGNFDPLAPIANPVLPRRLRHLICVVATPRQSASFPLQSIHMRGVRFAVLGGLFLA
jgi:hypothetical protein